MADKNNFEELEKYIEELRTIKRRKVDGTKKSFIMKDSYECTLNNGMVIYREQLKKGGRDGSAVVVLPVTVDGKVIVSIEPRVFIERTVGVGFPAGYIEEGEEDYVAALRELQEEVGCIPQYLVKLASFYQDAGISAAKNSVFLATGCTEGHVMHPDEGEIVRYVKLDFSEVLALEDIGYIADCNALIALAKAKDYFDERGQVREFKVKEKSIRRK